MSEKQMSDKQYNCIKWICEILCIDYGGTTSSYDAWKFIKDNKPLADKKAKEKKSIDDEEFYTLIQKDSERAVDLFVLQEMANVGYTKYKCNLNTHEREYYDDFDGINIDDDDIDVICPSGIHCADDIKDFGWMYALKNNLYL